ncbi:MAG: TonB protein [Caulobacter sp.]|nr:TonB protein [Caulobacter sp.]
MIGATLSFMLAFQGSQLLAPADIIWLRMPSGQEVSRIVPKTTARPWTGSFEIHCTIAASGNLTGCVAPDAPEGAPASEFCLKIARYFQAAPRTRSGVLTAGRSVRIPIRLMSVD